MKEKSTLQPTGDHKDLTVLELSRQHHAPKCYLSPDTKIFNEMNGAHLTSPIRGELGYAHWPQLGTQLGTKFGAH